MPRGIPDPAGIVSRECPQCGLLMFHYASQIGTFCSRSCADIAKIQPMPGRFWSKVDVRGPDECWLWTHSPCTDGYGKFWLDGKDVHPAHVALEIKLGRPIRDGYCACHDCPDGDNPLCCNPDHLWEGTPGDNSRDMATKGRSLRGSQARNAKLDEETVIRLRLQWDGTVTMARRFADERGMSITPMYNALRRKSWTHV